MIKADKVLTNEEASELYKQLFHKYKDEMEDVQHSLRMDNLLHGFITPVTAAKQTALLDKIKAEALNPDNLRLIK